MGPKVVAYGTQVGCKIDFANYTGIIAIGDDGEAYILAGHGMKELPNIGDRGILTFTKHDGPTKGHWVFTPDNQ